MSNTVKARGITVAKAKHYIACGGCGCPNCGSENVTGGSFDSDIGWERRLPTVVWQNVYCEDCDFEWQDVYTLTDVCDRDDKSFLVPD